MKAGEFGQLALAAFFCSFLLWWAWNLRMTIGRGRRQPFLHFRRMATILPAAAAVYLALAAWKPTGPASLPRMEAIMGGSLLAYSTLWLLPRGVWLRLPFFRLED